MSAFRVIWYRVPNHLIGGWYAVAVLNGSGAVVSRVTGIQTEAYAKMRAADYGRSYGTADVQEVQS